MTRPETNEPVPSLLRATLCLIGAMAAACAREANVRDDPSGAPQPAPAATAKATSGAGCSEEDLSRHARQVLEGSATYYADSLAGNATASGPAYDPDRYTAAHRTLPFGTRLRVTRTDVRGQPVCVTVNDRGPFGSRQRILDLSRRAARELEMIGEGVVPVRIDVL